MTNEPGLWANMEFTIVPHGFQFDMHDAETHLGPLNDITLCRDFGDTGDSHRMGALLYEIASRPELVRVIWECLSEKDLMVPKIAKEALDAL